jgi:hypothetical protein
LANVLAAASATGNHGPQMHGVVSWGTPTPWSLQQQFALQQQLLGVNAAAYLHELSFPPSTYTSPTPSSAHGRSLSNDSIYSAASSSGPVPHSSSGAGSAQASPAPGAMTPAGVGSIALDPSVEQQLAAMGISVGGHVSTTSSAQASPALSPSAKAMTLPRSPQSNAGGGAMSAAPSEPHKKPPVSVTAAAAAHAAATAAAVASATAAATVAASATSAPSSEGAAQSTAPVANGVAASSASVAAPFNA